MGSTVFWPKCFEAPYWYQLYDYDKKEIQKGSTDVWHGRTLQILFFNFKFSSLELKIFFKRPRPGLVSKKPRNNCTELSNSMTKRENKRNQQKYGSFPKGCPGAVWPNGKPSKKYCRGNGMDKWGNPKLLWHNTCCIWKGSKCRDNPKFKSKKNVIVSIGTMVEVPGPPYDITKAKTIVDISRHLSWTYIYPIRTNRPALIGWKCTDQY